MTGPLFTHLRVVVAVSLLAGGLIVLGAYFGPEWAVAAATIVPISLSAWVATESWLSRQETFRPLVLLYATRGHDDILLRLSNSGQRTGYDISVYLNAPFPMYFPDPTDSSINDPNDYMDLRDFVGILKFPTPVLAPTSSIECRLFLKRDDDRELTQTIVQRLIVPDMEPVSGVVKYRDSRGRTFTEAVRIDFRVFENLNFGIIQRTERHTLDLSSPKALKRSVEKIGLEVSTTVRDDP